MSRHFQFRQRLLAILLPLAPMLVHPPADAQVLEVVVGVTPNCPYGLEACWGVAREGLRHLDGVESIVDTPDVYNCTARVNLKETGLPKLEKWPRQFKSVVGEIQLLRGVELTVKGIVEQQGDSLVVSVPGLQQPISLAPLEHKLQWNFKKKARRGPEPDEKSAYEELVARTKAVRRLQVEVTGPFKMSHTGPLLEVRECFSTRN